MINPAYKDRRQTYKDLWAKAKLNPDRLPQIDRTIDRILTGKDKYRQIERQIGIPIHVTALIHAMEADCDFDCHLFNGDSLAARTINEPKGYPKEGNPPFSWGQSAVASLIQSNLVNWSDWTIPGILYQLEGYNGWGYVDTKIYSPYLWSYTNIYRSGKYVSDGKFDPEAVSGQPGAAAILMRMVHRGIVLEAPLWI